MEAEYSRNAQKELANPELKKYTTEEWFALATELFGPDPKVWEFVCPNCKNVQTIGDFIALREAGIDIEDAQVAYCSCIGRYDTRIPRSKLGTLGDAKGKVACDYTINGLISFCHTVVIKDGKEHRVFEFNMPEVETEETENARHPAQRRSPKSGTDAYRAGLDEEGHVRPGYVYLTTQNKWFKLEDLVAKHRR